MLKNITCPFCFETFGAADVEFRCINARCTREADSLYADARGLVTAPSMGHVFSAKHASWPIRSIRPKLSASCDLCNERTNKRLCPHCHFELSHDAGQIDDHVIAIIGGREAGKGHYVATLIHRLEHEVSPAFNSTLRMLGDDTRRRYEDDYRTPLIWQKSLLQPTQSAAVFSQTKTPMVFRLTSKHGAGKRAVNLSFFDSAGEDMQSLDVMSAETRYICNSAGILFLLDSLQIDAVRQQLSPDILPARDIRADPTHIVERLRELFERQSGLSATTRIKTPVAFVLSKIDALMPIVSPGSALRRTGEHFGQFNLADAQSVHTEIRNYLDTWMGSGFSNRVEMDFANFQFFGVSSLGQTPSTRGELETVSPLRVEDPFLWLLFQLGLIKGRKGP